MKNGIMYQVKVSYGENKTGNLQFIAVTKKNRTREHDDNYGLAIFFNGKYLTNLIVLQPYRQGIYDGKFIYIKDMTYSIHALGTAFNISNINKNYSRDIYSEFDASFKSTIKKYIVESLTFYNETSNNYQKLLVDAFNNPYISENDNLALIDIPADIEKVIIE